MQPKKKPTQPKNAEVAVLHIREQGHSVRKRVGSKSVRVGLVNKCFWRKFVSYVSENVTKNSNRLCSQEIFAKLFFVCGTTLVRNCSIQYMFTRWSECAPTFTSASRVNCPAVFLASFSNRFPYCRAVDRFFLNFGNFTLRHTMDLFQDLMCFLNVTHTVLYTVAVYFTLIL